MITNLNEFRKHKKKNKRKSKKKSGIYGLGYGIGLGLGYNNFSYHSSNDGGSNDSGGDSGGDGGGASESLHIEKVNPDVNDDMQKGIIAPHIAHRKAIIKMLLHMRDTNKVIPDTITVNDSFITTLEEFKKLR